MSNFTVACPHCGAANEDPFEVFKRGAVDWHCCVACSKRFHYLLADCEACGEESAFTWPVEPIGITLADLNCASCGARYGHDHKAQDGEAIW